MSRTSEGGREVMHLGARIRKNVAVMAMGLAILSSDHQVGAQQIKVHRIGFISSATSSAMAARDEAFRQGLRALGYVVGENIAIEYRWADGKNERLPGFAAELVNLKLDIIVTHGGAATRAVQQASTTIPIVIAAADDPLAAGLVVSLARPGGNTTGLSLITPDLTGKRLELLKEVLPGLTRVAVLWNSGNPISEPELRKAEAAARSLGLQLQSLGVRDPGEFARAFSSMRRERAGAIFLLSDAMFFGRRKEIVDLAVQGARSHAKESRNAVASVASDQRSAAAGGGGRSPHVGRTARSGAGAQRGRFYVRAQGSTRHRRCAARRYPTLRDAPCSTRRRGGREPAARDISGSGIRRGWGPPVVRSKPPGSVEACRRLRGQDLEGREAR